MDTCQKNNRFGLKAILNRCLYPFLMASCLMGYQTAHGQSPVINEVFIDPELNITYFNAYTGKVEVFVPEGVTLKTLTFTVTPVSFDVNTDPVVQEILWNYYVDGTPATNSPTVITIAVNEPDGLTGPETQTFDFTPIRPDNIYPEIQFAPSSVVYTATPDNSQIDRDRLHLMKFINPFEVVDNTAFFIEVYAEPVNETPPAPLDLEVYLVGKGKELSFFDGNWQDAPDVALVRAINYLDTFNHNHGQYSAHHLIPLTAASDDPGVITATIQVGDKEIDVNDDFWVVLYVNTPNANRAWNLKYHSGDNTGHWFIKDGDALAVSQIGYPDMHVHLARNYTGNLVDGVDLDLAVQYENSSGLQTLIDQDNYYYFSEIPNLPPNASSFTEPDPGTYSGTVTIAWNAASDPNNDPLTYNVLLVGSTATYTLATGLTATTYELNTLNYPNGYYDIIVEACDAEFCTGFAWSSGVDADEGEDDFFRIMNPPPPPVANDDDFCINAATDLDVLANDEFDEYYNTVGSITVTITEQPVAGTATVNTDGTIAFDPTGGTTMTENQAVTFTYRVFDPDFPGVFDEAVVSVRYLTVNNPPDANDVSANTTTELAVAIDVLANDTDPQGSELFVDAIVSGPIAGSAVINPDQTITYTPFTGFEGTDSFVYQVCNESCGDLDPACATATVTITVIFAHYVCRDGSSTISIDEVPGATGYVWTLPLGSTPLGTVTVTQSSPAVIAVTNDNQLEVDWSGVVPGEYSICVEPENDCGPGTDQCMLLVVSDIELTATPNDVLCKGENDGSIDLVVSGGIMPYTYAWTKVDDPLYSANVQNPGGLSPGEYQVLVADKYGCVGTISATITEPVDAISVSGVVTDEDPFGDANGAIELTVSGGTGSYTFQWTKEDDLAFSETTQNISGLTGGIYKVVVTDENGCEEMRFFTVDQIGGPLEIFAEPTHVLCFGEATGSIDLFVIGGVASYTFSWEASDGGTIPSGQEDNQNLTGLTAGTYTVTVTDSDDPGVSETLTIIITEPEAELIAIATETDVTCFGANNGAIEVAIIGGTAPYKYQWNTGAVTQNLINLSPGTYTVTVTDANGCIAIAEATINEPTEIVIVGLVSNSSCSAPVNGSISLTSVTGGSPDYNFSWTGPNGFTSTDQDISNLVPGTYIVNVTDANGCTTQKSFTVRNVCVDVTKTLLSGPTNNGDGTYNLTYQIAVKNTGNTNLLSVQVGEDLAATYTTFSGVSISSTKFSVNGGYTGSTPDTDLLAAGQTLTPGEEGRINISFTVSDVTVTPATTYTNTATATAEDADGVQTSDTDDNGVTFNEDPIIGVAKALTTGPTITPDGSYDVSFTITVRNYGDVPLNNVQVTDDLDAAFGAGTYSVTDVTGSTGFTANWPGFSGSSVQNLLSASTPMAINEIRTIVVSLTVTPDNPGPFENQATGTATGPGGTPTTDLSQDGTNPDPDNDGDPTNNDVPTPIVFPENPEIGLAKRLVSAPINNNDGTYSLTYEIRVRNTGDVILYDVQIEDDLTATFPSKTVVVNTISSTTLTPNFPGYNGDTNIYLLSASGNTLAVDETKIITLEITVTTGDDLGPYNNSAFASGSSAFGSTVTDTSNDGIDVNPDNTNPNNHTTPTPVEFQEVPAIELAKSLSSVVNNEDGSYNVVYTIEVSNTGDVPLVNVQVTDDLTATFDGADSFEVITVGASGDLDANTGFNGDADKDLLISANSSVAHNSSETITVTIRVTPGTKLGVYNNIASSTATGPGTTPAADDSNIVPLTFTENPSLAVEKSILDNDVTDNEDDSFTFTYEIRVENTGDVPLNSLQVVDDLAVAFADATNGYTVHNTAIHTQPSSTSLTINNTYNGGSDANLLDETLDQDLNVSEFAVIRINLTVSFDPTDPAGPYINEAFAFALTPGGNFTSNLDDDLVTFNFEDPVLELTKTLESVVDSYDATGEETQRVTFRLKIESLGNVNLTDLEIFDDIVNQFAVFSPQNFETEEGLSLFVNPDWDGTAASNILEAGQFFDDEIEDDYFVFISFDVTPGLTLSTLNTATAFGSTPLGGTASDTSSAVVEYLQPEIALLKEIIAGDPFSDIGDEIEYRFTITNTGDVTIIGPFTIEDDKIGTLNDCASGPLAPGSATSCTATYTVTTGDMAAGFVTNEAFVTATYGGEPIESNTDTATANSTGADLAIAKTVDNATPNVGTDVIFTIVVTNNGPAAATNVLVTDQLPNGYTYVSATTDPSVNSYDEVTGTWEAGTLVNGATATLTITATVNEPGPGIEYVNTASVTADQPDPVPENNEDEAEVTPQQANLAITKIVDNATPNVGDEVTFTITITNNGPDDATGIVVQDQLPSGYTYASSIPSLGTYNSDTGIWMVGALLNGNSATLEITALVEASGDYNNIATITEADQFDPDETNNTDSASTSPGAVADLSITKTDSPDPVFAGNQLTYFITVTNNGPSQAENVVVTDNIPPELSDVVVTPSTGTWTDPLWNIGSLANGETVTMTITATVNSNVTGSINNIATVTSTTTDPDTSNNTAEETTTVNVSADMAVTKIAVPDPVIAGEQITYTINVVNNGPSDAVNVVVNDNIPSALSVVVETSTGSWSAPNWTIGAFPAGEAQTMTITATVNADVTGPITNTASVSSDTPDPEADNNTSTVSSGVDALADVSVVKTQVDGDALPAIATIDPSVITAGTKIYYRLLVTNNGPSYAQNVVITDNLPAGLTGAEYSLNNGSTWDPWSGTRTLNPFEFPGVNDILIRADLDPSATGSLANIATVTSTTPDPDLDNNESELVTTISTLADLSLTKSVVTSPVIFGEQIEYLITVTNLGPADAQDVVITDIFDPANITGVEYLDGASWEPWTDNLNIGTLEYDDIYTLIIRGNVEADASDPIPNTATVTSTTNDPNPDNNSQTINTPVNAEADLEIIKDGPAQVVAGTTVSYTLTVTNNGPSPATNVIVTDNLPTSLVSRTFSLDGGDTYNPWTGSVNLGTLADTETVSFIIQAQLADNATGILTNTATVSSDVPDPDSSNNTSTTSAPISVVSDLQITKIQIDPAILPVDENNLPDNIFDLAVDPPEIIAGEMIHYLLVYQNNGPSEATFVLIEDDIPGEILNPQSSRCQAAFVNWTGSATVTTLSTGELCVIVIRGTVDPGATGNIVNTATISSDDVDDPIPANNSSTFTTTILGEADLLITKTDSPDPVIAGEELTYVITVTNNGPAFANDVVVTDVLPAQLTLVSATPSVGTWSDPQWNIGTLANATSVELTLVAVVDPAATASIINVATVTSTTPDPGPGPNTVTQVTTVNPQADLAITKTDGQSAYTPGEEVVYTVVISNSGPSDAPGAIVTDNAPAGTSISSWSASFAGGASGSAAGTGNINQTVNIPAGATITYTITVDVPAGFTGDLTNTASVAPPSGVTDPDMTNNTDSDTNTQSSLADVAVTKTVNNPSPQVGESITFTIEASNAGPSQATGIVVADQLPAGLSYLSNDGGTKGSVTQSAGTITWTMNTLNPGETATLIITALVLDPTGAAGEYINIAIITADQPDPVPENNEDDAEVTPVVDASIELTKEASQETYVLDDEIIYTFTVTNDGNVTLSDVSVNDPLAGLSTITPASAASLAPGATAIFSATYTITFDDMTAGFVENIATATGTFNDTPYSDTAEETITAIRADLAIIKTGPNTILAGEEITYTITVNNLGPNTAENVVVADDVPAEIVSPTFSTDNFGTSDPWVSPFAIGNLTNGEIFTFEIRGVVSNSTPLGATITNTAMVDSDTFDHVEANNTSTKTTDVNTSADLRIEKLVSDDPVIAGTEIIYTLTITNDGPSDAQDVTISDDPPTQILNPEYSTDNGASWDDWVDPFQYANGTLPANDSFELLIRGTVNANTPDGTTITNTASVGSSTPDPDLDNNTDEIPALIERVADLSIVKTQVDASDWNNLVEIDPPVITPGTNIYYLLTVENFGPSYAAGVVIEDILPAGITNPVFSLYPSVTLDTWTGTRTIPDFEYPGSNQILIRGFVDPDFTGALTNTATISSTLTHDPNLDNNTSEIVTQAEPMADLSITKEVIGGTVSKGETITYRLRINNSGPSTATGIEVEDIIHPEIDDVEYALGAPTGWDDWTGSVNVGSLEPGAPAIVLYIRGTVLDMSPDLNTDPIPNTATVTSEVDDPNPDNNSATIFTPLDVEADLALTKEGPLDIVAGTTITYTITVINNSGTFASEDVHVEDIINPARIINAEYSFDESSWSTWTNSLALGTLSPTQTVTFYIRGKVASNISADQIINIAEVFSSTPDPDNSNNIGTVTTTILREADLEVIKIQIDPVHLPLDLQNLPPYEDLVTTLSVDPMEIIAGETIYYALLYKNYGPSEATNVVISDDIPNMITNVMATRCQFAPNPWTGQTPSFTLPVGDYCLILITGEVLSDATGVITNTGTIASADVDDPNLDNNTSTIETQITTSADLRIVKTGSPNPVTAGEEIIYTLTVTNLGPSEAMDVWVYDDVDVRVLDPEYFDGSDWVTWPGFFNYGDLPNGNSFIIQIRGTVDPSVPQTNQIVNVATVTSTLTPDPDPNNNTSTATNSVNRFADLKIVKSADPEPVIPGQTLTYTIAVENLGPSDARDVEITDNLPAGLLSIDATPTEGTWVAPKWTIGNMAVGTTQTLTITAIVDELPDGTTIVNTATVDSGTNDPDPDNNTSTVTSTISVPDITPTITAIPDVMQGTTDFDIIVRITELNQVNTNGLITIRIPKDTRWVLNGSFEPGLTELNSTALDNADWSYSEDQHSHIFTTTAVITAGDYSIFGFRATFDPGQTRGVFTITCQIESWSGGENRIDNNVDSQRLEYHFTY